MASNVEYLSVEVSYGDVQLVVRDREDRTNARVMRLKPQDVTWLIAELREALRDTGHEASDQQATANLVIAELSDAFRATQTDA